MVGGRPRLTNHIILVIITKHDAFDLVVQIQGLQDTFCVL
jgi:hypothetical protein